MRDNLSIIITMLVFVILIVIFPLYNYFERQDDMSYNMVLKATTNFVDEVINCGYIDQKTYDNFMQKLAITGNLFDVQIEAHKKVYTKDPYNKEADTFIEQYEVDYNNEIFDEATGNTKDSNVDINNKVLKNGVYYLNVGDQIYVKLKNSSTTMAGAIFNIIVPTSKKERLTVNYGGIIKNNAWEKQEVSNLFQKDIYIDILVDQITTPGLPDKINDKPTYSIDQNGEVKFNVKIVNYDKSTEGNISAILKDNLKLTGFESEKSIKPINVTKIAGKSEWAATFNLESLKATSNEYFGSDFYKTCQVTLEPGLIQGSYFKNELTVSDTITIKRTNIQNQLPNITGPYLSGSSAQVSSAELGSTLIYYLNYYSANLLVNENEMVNFIEKVNFGSNKVVIKNEPSNKRFKISFTNINGIPNQKIHIKVTQDWAQYLDVATGTIKKVGNLKSNECKITFSKKRYDSPGIYTVVIPTTGKYKLEVVGANGGGNTSSIMSQGSRGGKGGRSVGTIKLNKGDKLYVVVGGAGLHAVASGSGTGGYNGGGNGARYPTSDPDYPNSFGSGGGGATDIRLSGTAITSPMMGLQNRIIVAGGGGGADDFDVYGTSFSGSTGGYNDGSGGYGGGGNSAGGYGFVNGTTVGGAKSGGLTSGFSLGIGQNFIGNIDGAGGGGGYYGGFSSLSSANNSGAGGGSGYIAPEFTDISGTNGYNTSQSGNGWATIEYMGS